MTVSQPSLQQIYKKYEDYVTESLLYESSHSEIAGFDEWANSHYGIPFVQAQEFFYGIG